MNCGEFKQYAEQWMEGEQHGNAAAHLRECAVCQGLIADLEAIRDAAPSLADDVAPPARMWASIHAQLQTEGLIRKRSFRDQLAELFRPAPRPALAGAFAAVLALAMLLVYSNRPVMPEQPAALWTASNEKSFQNLASQLDVVQQDALPAMHEQNPVIEASFQDSLAIVDNSIEICEKAVRDTPEDEMARDYLYEAYQQKADLLNTIAERGSGIGTK